MKRTKRGESLYMHALWRWKEYTGKKMKYIRNTRIEPGEPSMRIIETVLANALQQNSGLLTADRLYCRFIYIAFDCVRHFNLTLNFYTNSWERQNHFLFVLSSFVRVADDFFFWQLPVDWTLRAVNSHSLLFSQINDISLAL